MKTEIHTLRPCVSDNYNNQERLKKALDEGAVIINTAVVGDRITYILQKKQN